MAFLAMQEWSLEEGKGGGDNLNEGEGGRESVFVSRGNEMYGTLHIDRDVMSSL